MIDRPLAHSTSTVRPHSLTLVTAQTWIASDQVKLLAGVLAARSLLLRSTSSLTVPTSRERRGLRWRAHLPVTVAVAVINICWLFPLALLVGLGYVDGLLSTLIAYAPLAIITIWLNAGRPSAA